MKKTVKLFLSIVVSLCMILSVMPFGIFADSEKRICFDTGNIVGNTAYFNVNGNDIEISVSGANIDNGTVYVPNGDMSGISFVITGDFDAQSMHVVFRGENNYRGELSVGQDGVLDYSGLVLPDGELLLAIESDNGGSNDDWEEHHTIHFKDATVVDSDTVVFGSGNDAITMEIHNAEIDNDGVIRTDWASELYGIEFELDSNFDTSTMKLFALALDGYTGELFISRDGTATFINPEDDEDRLYFADEIFISLDDYLMYAIVRDSNGNRYLDGETLKLSPGDSVFLWCETHRDNASHGVFPAVGFNYGVAGDGNFADSLTSMGFTVTEGDAQTLGYAGNEIDPNTFGCEVTVPNDMQIGTQARMTYSLYELPENFSWDDMWANFSWSETPIIQTNNLNVEVREPWRLYCDATVYTQGGFEKTVFDGTTLYIGRNESIFIQVNSDYEWNPRYGVTNFYSFNFNQVTDDGYHVEFCDATEKGYPDVGFGIYIEPDNNRDFINTTELCFGVHYYPENENDEMDYSNPAAKCYLNLEIREYNPCIYMVDQYGMIYNDGDSIFFDEDETKAVAFRTDLRNADHGYYKDYIGWNTDVLENAGFTIIDAGPAHFFDDYKDDFLADDFIIIVKAENLNYGTNVDYDTWLYEYVDDDDFDWATTPVAYESTFNFKVAPLYGTTGDCFWSYDIGSKTLEIAGDGAMADYTQNTPAPWRAYDIENAVILDGVTHIGTDAFLFSNVKEVEIAGTVTSIGTNAFNGCGKLRWIDLPDGLVSVGPYAFASTSINEVMISSSVTSIGVCAFAYYYDENIDDDVLVDGFILRGWPDTAAEAYANDNNIDFYDETVYTSQDGNWKYRVLPDGSCETGSDVLGGNAYLGNDVNVVVPSTIDNHPVKKIGGGTFSSLDFIESITIPDGITEIGFAAFRDCTSLEELNLPEGLECIGASVVENTALANDSQNFRNGGLYVDNYLLRAETNYYGDFSVEDGTVLIALAAFCNCEAERVFLPGSITEIGDQTFHDCLNLREVGIPDSVTIIRYGAFSNCPSLKEISISASVDFIDEGNFIYHDYNTGNEYVTLERIFGFDGTFAERYADELGVDFISMSGGTTGDCDWYYDYNDKSITISGNGAMADYGFIPGANEPIAAPWSNLDIEKVVIENGVTRIGNDAFMGMRIFDADIADSVISIGTNAFHSCGGLDFVILPPALTEVGAYAFYNTQLSEIEIPSTVTSIGQCAFGFYYDSDLDRDITVDGFTIYGFSGTAAETYANTHGFTFFDNTVYLSKDGLWKYTVKPDGTAMLYCDIPWGYSYQGHDSVVTIPSVIDGYTVSEIGATAMSNLNFVTKITVPNTVTRIGFSAFSGDTSLTELILPDTIDTIGAQVIDNTAIPYVDGAVYCNGYLLRVDTNYEGTFTVKPGTKLMGMYSFGNCSKIERIILPDSINKIDEATFVGCTSLKEILIPHSVGYIYDRAFTDYNEQTGQTERLLERIYGSPNTGAEAFANQKGIPFVNIEAIVDGDINGDGEISLPDYQITKDYIAGNDLTIFGLIAGDVNGDGAVDAFDLFEIDKTINANAQPKFAYTVTGNQVTVTSYLANDALMVIPDTLEGFKVVKIDKNAFKNNTSITGAIISGNVETIDNYAFMGCTNLTRVDFADGLQRINFGAFLNCSALTSVNLGGTVRTIGSNAFKGTGLTSIYIPASVTSISTSAFDGCTNLTIFGEAGSYAESFANANNINFAVPG